MPSRPEELHPTSADVSADVEEVKVELRFAPNIKASMTSALHGGLHRPVLNALAEITDGVVEATVDSKAQTTQLIVTLPGKAQSRKRSYRTLTVEGLNEEGMDLEDLRRLLNVGESRQKGIGHFGVGHDIAGWLLANRMAIKGKKPGDEREFVFDDPKFGDPAQKHEGIRTVQTPKAKDVNQGRVTTTLTDLKIPEKEWPKPAETKRALAELYRPRLSSEPTAFGRNRNPKVPPRVVVTPKGELVEKNDRLVAWVISSKGADQVTPLEIPLVPGDTEDLRVIWTGEEEPIALWVGERDHNDPQAKRVDPGLRCYVDGRLILKKYTAGHEPHPATRDLVGEVHLDQVEGIIGQTSMGKSSMQINLGSPPWKRVQSAVHDEIAPFVEELKNRAPEFDQDEIPKVAARALIEIHRLAEMGVGEYLKDWDEALEALGLKKRGTIQAQNPPDRSGESEADTPQAPATGVAGTPWARQEGKTHPTPGASPDIKRKRRAVFDKLRYQDFGKGDDALSVVTFEKSGKREKVYLDINLSHPRVQMLFEAARVNPAIGKVALSLLVNGEFSRHAALRIAPDEVDDFIEHYEGITYAADSLLAQTPVVRKLQELPDG